MSVLQRTKEKMRKLLNSLILLLILGSVMQLLSCQQQSFTGNRIKNADSYILDIEWMNGTDLHTMELNKNDTLHIRFEAERGSMYMEIKAPDGTSVYRGNGKEITEFTVDIPKSGVYAIVVEARRARGIVQVQHTGSNMYDIKGVGTENLPEV